MDLVMRQLTYAITRHQTASPAMEGPQEAVVVAASAASVQVVIPVFSPDYQFGPAPYQPVPGGVLPPAGTRCLVMFVGTDLSRPYVVMFVGWNG
jgi:hypothetical protein